MTGQEGQSEWQAWAQATSQRVQWAEQRLQGLQDLSIKWSTWAFNVADRMDDLEARMNDLEVRMGAVEVQLQEQGTEMRQSRLILLNIARHLNIPDIPDL